MGHNRLRLTDTDADETLRNEEIAHNDDHDVDVFQNRLPLEKQKDDEEPKEVQQRLRTKKIAKKENEKTEKKRSKNKNPQDEKRNQQTDLELAGTQPSDSDPYAFHSHIHQRDASLLRRRAQR